MTQTNTPSKELTQIYQEIDKALRTASCATLKPIKSIKEMSDPCSLFGGITHGSGDEDWPFADGKPMLPLFQLDIKELPHIPKQLKPYDFLTVFISHSPVTSFLSNNGEGWLIRTYSDKSSLIPITPPPQLESKIKPCLITWSRSKKDAPDWEDAWEITDVSPINNTTDGIDLYYERYENFDGTKIGGWPSLIQTELSYPSKAFVFQIASEPEADWMWGDAGIGYFGLSEKGHWMLEWQCY
jgi:uncharacterized protein YwqG